MDFAVNLLAWSLALGQPATPAPTPSRIDGLVRQADFVGSLLKDWFNETPSPMVAVVLTESADGRMTNEVPGVILAEFQALLERQLGTTAAILPTNVLLTRQPDRLPANADARLEWLKKAKVDAGVFVTVRTKPGDTREVEVAVAFGNKAKTAGPQPTGVATARHPTPTGRFGLDLRFEQDRSFKAAALVSDGRGKSDLVGRVFAVIPDADEVRVHIRVAQVADRPGMLADMAKAVVLVDGVSAFFAENPTTGLLRATTLMPTGQALGPVLAPVGHRFRVDRAKGLGFEPAVSEGDNIATLEGFQYRDVVTPFTLRNRAWSLGRSMGVAKSELCVISAYFFDRPERKTSPEWLPPVPAPFKSPYPLVYAVEPGGSGKPHTIDSKAAKPNPRGYYQVDCQDEPTEILRLHYMTQSEIDKVIPREHQRKVSSGIPSR